jgi:excisionase family DNA binding protein
VVVSRSEQITRHLGVTRDSIYLWIDAKELPSHNIGHLWKIKVSGVDEWIRRGGAQENNTRKGG